MARLTGLPLDQCVGRGTGLDDAGVQRKLAVLQQALQANANAAQAPRCPGGIGWV
jgi:nicotinate-nucleotide--dimethylbenzimidazole phosphoribosyltransferase